MINTINYDQNPGLASVLSLVVVENLTATLFLPGLDIARAASDHLKRFDVVLEVKRYHTAVHLYKSTFTLLSVPNPKKTGCMI